MGFSVFIGQKPRKLTTEEERLLTSMADQIGVAVENTTLFEVLAKAGGITANMGGVGGGMATTTNTLSSGLGLNYASKIKILRGDMKKPDIYLVDFSKLEGLKDADIIMHANDIVYIEPVINYPYTVASDIASITGIVSTFLSVILLYKLINTK